MEDETFPDIGSTSDEELEELIDNLTADTLIKGDDVQRLGVVLAGRSEPPTKPST